MTLAALVAGCGGCGSPAHNVTDTSPAGTEARSAKVRVTAPAVPPADALQLAADNRAFAVALYKSARGAGADNLVLSPASISIALAMLYGGSAGATATEIAQALHFALPPERLHPAFDALDLALATAPPTLVSGTFRLSVANAIWGQAGFVFMPTYLDLLAQSYGAGLRLVDFSTAPEPARATINSWVSDQTNHKIPMLLPAGSVDSGTRLVLTNAVYFLGDWDTPFESHSSSGIFHAPGGDVTVAKMMSGPNNLAIWGGAGWRAAALPYVGGTTSMVVVVPEAGTLDTFESGLTGDSLGAILAAASMSTPGAVTLPAFDFKTATDLPPALMALGMRQAFDSSQADLSGIDGTRDLYVSDVLHQATIAVDEKGTEASAATAVIIRETAAVLNTLTVDRPFLFFIRHDPTGAILFQGRVLDPTK
jgi:serpin B